MYLTLLFVASLLSVVLWEAAGVAMFGRIRNRKIRLWVRIPTIGIWIAALVWPLIPVARARFDPNLRNIEPLFDLHLGFVALSLICIGILHIFTRRRIRRDLPPLPIASRVPLLIGCAFAWVASIVFYRAFLVQRERLVLETVNAVCSRYANGLDRIPPGGWTGDANAATWYGRAISQLSRASSDDIQRLDSFSMDEVPPGDPQVSACLLQQQQTIALLRIAATTPACRFPDDDLYPQIEVEAHNIDVERKLAVVLEADARAARLTGDISRAIRDADTILLMSRHFTKRPSLVWGLYGIGVHEMGLDVLRKALIEVKSPRDLEPLHTALIPLPCAAFQQSLRGETVYILAMILDANPDAPVPNAQSSLASPMGHTINANSAFMMTAMDFATVDQTYERIASISARPYYQVESQIPDARPDDQSATAKLLGPALNRSVMQWYKVQATDACAQTAVAMTRYRIDHGTLPRKLNVLIPQYLPALPVDPGDGEPIKLSTENGRWMLYSVGAGGIDTGHAPEPSRDSVTYVLTK